MHLNTILLWKQGSKVLGKTLGILFALYSQLIAILCFLISNVWQKIQGHRNRVFSNLKNGSLLTVARCFIKITQFLQHFKAVIKKGKKCKKHIFSISQQRNFWHWSYFFQPQEVPWETFFSPLFFLHVPENKGAKMYRKKQDPRYSIYMVYCPAEHVTFIWI